MRETGAARFGQKEIKNQLLTVLAAALVGAGALSATTLLAQDAATDDKAAAAELAKKLSNPVASFISVPLQNNFDFGTGPGVTGSNTRSAFSR